MSGNVPPVDIEFVIKNTDFSAATKQIKKEITDVGVTADKVSKQVEEDLVNSLNNAGKAAASAGSKFSAGTSGIGQMQKGMSSLGFSMQQVARELPSLAISPQMFFLAISNNLPILQDQIRKTRIENEALKASGQAAVPVWKQLAGSLFSWQTALVAGITILTVYGKDIFAWVKNLVSVRREIELTRKEIKELTKDFSNSLGAELGKANQLFTALEKSQKGTAEYYKAKRDIINQYGDYLNGMSSEITMLNNIEGAYRAVTEALKEQARQKVITETQSKEAAKVVEQEAKSYQKISDAFNAKFGTKIGGFKFEQFRKEFEAGKGFSLEMQRIIESFKTATPQVIGSSVTGFTQTITTDVNIVKDAINGITQAQTDAQQKIQQVQNLFGKITSGQTSQIVSLIQKQRDELAVAKLMPEATEAEIKAKNKKIEVIEKEIDRLEKLGKAGKEGDYQKQLMAELEAAVKSGSQTAIDEAAKRIVIYEQEKDLLREIIELAAFEMKYADQHKTITAIQPKGIGSEPNKGDLKTVENSNGRKLLYEIVAINKTGPIWKKIGLESDKLTKLIIANAKKADKIGEEIDEDEARRKAENYENLLSYSRQFTSELIQQLGLTNEQARALEGVADVAFNLLKGDLLGAGFSIASFYLTSIIQAFKESDADPLEKSLEKINKTLEAQTDLLNNLRGNDWFSVAAKQATDLAQSIELSSQKLRNMPILSAQGQDILDTVKVGSYGGNYAIQDIINRYKIDTKNWGIDEFVKAVADGVIKLNDEATAELNAAVSKQKQLFELLDESWNKITGTTRESIADSIIEGFQNGYDSAEDFANNFEELMKTAIINSFKTKLIEEDLTKWYSGFAEVAKDGLTADEIAEQQRLWDELINQKQLDWEKIAQVTGIDLSNAAQSRQQGLTGAISGITEEQADLLAGLFTALRIDIKDILKQMAAADNDTVQSLAYLKEIAENTRHNVRLKAIEEGIVKTNKLLDERL